ncbi:hypothetical protein D9756_006154 [Leucocoprinus leucothites]|uniref:Uncharacterized protein n=1 Tax=Leucocoprinus leucothites TaxID=201217 RepID=A0A8H5D3B4_9AGAR|nr:hypothetical protein D9756_006154 [Leucoagaricus leucothites]
MMKQMVKKVIGKKQDKQTSNVSKKDFDPDCETLVNVPIRSAPRQTESPVDISFIEDLVWGPAPPPHRGQQGSISSRR